MNTNNFDIDRNQFYVHTQNTAISYTQEMADTNNMGFKFAKNQGKEFNVIIEDYDDTLEDEDNFNDMSQKNNENLNVIKENMDKNSIFTKNDHNYINDDNNNDIINYFFIILLIKLLL